MNWRSALAVVAAYAVAAVVLTWPLALHLPDRLGAPQGPGDPYLNLWILGWGLRAWTTNPASVLTGEVFNANIFHPAENTLAYSDHFLLQSLALSPLFAITGSVVLCYNVLLLASLALSGVAMHAFVRAVTASTAAAFVAGLAWACWSYRTAHLLHLQLQALYFMPLALLGTHRLMAGRRWRDAFALGAVAGLQAVASVYYGVMTGVAVAVTAVVLASATGQALRSALWKRMALAGVVASVVVLPVLVPYVRSQQAEGFGRTLYEAANHAAAVQSYLQAPSANLVYGTTGVLSPRPPRAGARDRSGVEHLLFPGLAVTLLAALGAWRHRSRDTRPLVWVGVALVAAGATLSFGPEGVRPLYAWLHDNVYGFQAIRAPARFAVVAMSGLSLLAALGIRELARGPRGARVAGIVIAVAAVEYLNAPLRLASAPPSSTPVGQWLSAAPEPGAVVHLPLHADIENTLAMVQSLEHGRPIVNGYSGQRPPFFSAIVEALADMPGAEALATLKELDVRFVVSGRVIAGAGNARSPLVERARLDGGIIYELRWTEESVAALSEVSVPAPPPPGAAPFRAGERATYDVYWDGGPLDVPAGRAVIRVVDGEPGERWEFEATAETADWVSTFYQARDRFVTTANGALEPIEHSRTIREGRRQIDRAYLFDRDARVVRIADSVAAARRGEGITLPLGGRAVRDAVTALFYVRTLSLAPGAVVSVPVNEGGASLVLQVNVAEHESIEVDDEPISTLRLEPRLMRRIERRRPINMTIWLSDDLRRVPVRVLVDAGFGRFRADLVDYRQ